MIREYETFKVDSNCKWVGRQLPVGTQIYLVTTGRWSNTDTHGKPVAGAVITMEQATGDGSWATCKIRVPKGPLYVIRHKEPDDDGAAVYWSNTLGWTGLEDATRYPSMDYTLPDESNWEALAKAEHEHGKRQTEQPVEPAEGRLGLSVRKGEIAVCVHTNDGVITQRLTTKEAIEFSHLLELAASFANTQKTL
ncbi:MAG: hypothetical protein NXI32_04925 [bacterium]|nr:hypothetical protein [bacterium]